MALIDILSLISMSGVLLLLSMYLYYVIKGNITPNAATWAIWGSVNVVNSVTYFKVVDGDLSRWAATGAACLGSLLILGYAAFNKRFSKIGPTEWMILAIAGVIVYYWRTSGDDVMANLLLQAVYVLSFIPTVLGVLKGNKENILPWYIAVVSYMIMTTNLVIHWQPEQQLVSLVHPILIGVMGNGSVAIAIRHMNKKHNN